MSKDNMSNKYNRKHVFGKEGDLLPIEQRTFTTNENLGEYKLVLINGGSKINYVIIKIHDWISEVRIEHVKTGNIKYPFHPSVFGVGYFGVGNHIAKENGKQTKVYQLWISLLERSYCLKCHTRQPTYKDVTVHPDWYNFQTFAVWFEQSNYQEGWELDKDLLSVDSKVYSPDTCIFIPKTLNSFLANRHSDNTSGHIGVSWYKRDCKWVANIRDKNIKKTMHLGYFDDVEEASIAYKKQREIFAIEWQSEMTGILPSNVIDNIK